MNDMFEERLQLAIEATRLGIWHFEPATKTLTWDDQCKAMFGLSPGAHITYESFLGGLLPDDRERTQ